MRRRRHSPRPSSSTQTPRGEQESGYQSYAAAPGLESPFRSEAMGTSGEAEGAPERAEFENLVANLYESEFNEALYELAAEAAMAAQEQLGSQEAESPAEREQLLEQYMAPLAAEAEGLFGRLSEQYAQHDISTLSEQEIDRLFRVVAAELRTPLAGIREPFRRLVEQGEERCQGCRQPG
jgi:signal transduction histidine kinase